MNCFASRALCLHITFEYLPCGESLKKQQAKAVCGPALYSFSSLTRKLPLRTRAQVEVRYNRSTHKGEKLTNKALKRKNLFVDNANMTKEENDEEEGWTSLRPEVGCLTEITFCFDNDEQINAPKRFGKKHAKDYDDKYKYWRTAVCGLLDEEQMASETVASLKRNADRFIKPHPEVRDDYGQEGTMVAVGRHMLSNQTFRNVKVSDDAEEILRSMISNSFVLLRELLVLLLPQTLHPVALFCAATAFVMSVGLCNPPHRDMGDGSPSHTIWFDRNKKSAADTSEGEWWFFFPEFKLQIAIQDGMFLRWDGR